jgi:hypothetical protein
VCCAATIHFGLRDLTGSHQRVNACVGQSVTVPAHAVFQAACLKPPLAAEPAIVVCTMPDVLSACLRGTKEQKDQNQSREGSASSDGRVYGFLTLNPRAWVSKAENWPLRIGLTNPPNSSHCPGAVYTPGFSFCDGPYLLLASAKGDQRDLQALMLGTGITPGTGGI